MAVVKPTDSAWREVESKINNMFQKRIDYAANWANYGMSIDEFNTRCFDNIVPPEDRKIFQALGEKYFNPADAINVTISKQVYRLTFPKCFLPDKLTGYGPNNHVTDPEILDICKRRCAAYSSIIQEREAFVQKVKKLWKSAPSVNSIAKVWPSILDLLPADIIKRMNTKKERRNLIKTVDVADLTTLSTHLLKAKVAR